MPLPTLRFASTVVAPPHAPLELAAVAAHARRVEEAGFTALIVPDVATVPSAPPSFVPPAATSSFEPLTLLAALATRTERLGLVATVTTSLNEPFHVARRLASLDHMSGGRAGWNVDTNVVPRGAGGFSRNDHDEPAPAGRGGREGRADEFLRVVRGLWDSYADDAIVAEKRSGLYFRPSGRRPLDHAGAHFRVAGPLNVSRPPQGHPVIFQAAARATEIEFAGRHADVVLGTVRSIGGARDARARLDAALVAANRAPGSVQVWPGLVPVVTSTEHEATTQRDDLLDNGPMHPGPGDTDAPVVVGTPEQVAALIIEWFHAGAADGFVVPTPILGAGTDPFLDEVLPILARAGVFAAPEGATLRDHLGLSRPARSVA